MPTLTKQQRKHLADITQQARDLAEEAARAALENLAVHEGKYRGHMDDAQRRLRNRLRARGRALGDRLDKQSNAQGIDELAEAAAYEHWHRLLFTRFLAENGLLHTDDAYGNVPVTLAECDELAPELDAEDGFDLACRFAARTLPGVFRADDPVLELRLAPNHAVGLRRLLDKLPAETFRADDALGWTYQFWQAKRKEQINKSGVKIGARELPAVTQLFTEDYMVEFLLHNSLGAWWAGRCVERGVCDLSLERCLEEQDARAAVGLAARDGLPGVAWTYLRFVRPDAGVDAEGESGEAADANSSPDPDPDPDFDFDRGRGAGADRWQPAAGTFDGWPRAAAEITMLDPCMGSGHFLVFALPILARLRMDEEGLSAGDAVAAVLRDNLHGLEIDERCTQIAAFNVALAAWKLGGYQVLPEMQLACSGLAPNVSKAEWMALADRGAEFVDMPPDRDLFGVDDDLFSLQLRTGMERLYDLFDKALVLGSLIDPRTVGRGLFRSGFQQLQPLLASALAGETHESRRELAATAQGLAKAGEILAGRFDLVATNVP